MNVEKQVLGVLTTRMGIKSADLHRDSELFTSGLLDSLKVMELVSCVEGIIGRSIPPEDISMEHFNSVGRIVAYVNTLGLEPDTP